MLPFANDYSRGAHPQVLKRLVETNLEALPGYGADRYTIRAQEKIKAACQAPDADVTFIAGGTQTNAVVISAMLDDEEGVVAAETGHVSAHEAGAIEYTGHKVLTLPQFDGKLTAETLKTFLETFYEDENHVQMVYPGMVYISNPTEYGTLYQKQELAALANVCHQYQLPLFMDGARLGYGLASPANELTLPEIAQYCDAFYIGGTKVGALCGEAVVFTKHNRPKHFVTKIKRQGALLAKGRLIGVQFDALFTDQLYFQISQHAIDLAMTLKALLREKGYDLYIDSPTNQQFVILNSKQLDQLKQAVEFTVWERLADGRTVIRLATSWSTTAEEVQQLGEIL